MNRSTFLRTILAAPAALWALTRPTHAVDWRKEVDPKLPRVRAAVCYQRFYTKLTERVVPLRGPYSVPLRTHWIVGSTAEGDTDRFRQLERFERGEWVVEDCWREQGRKRIRGSLQLNRWSYVSNRASWARDIVAIARWSEWETT